MNISEIEKALNKPALYGPDIDLLKYKLEEAVVEEARDVDPGVASAAPRVGLEPGKLMYVQSNERALYMAMARALSKYGVIVAPTREGLEKKPLVKEIAWRLVNPASDKYTASAYLYGGRSRLLHICSTIYKGSNACLYMLSHNYQ